MKERTKVYETKREANQQLAAGVGVMPELAAGSSLGCRDIRGNLTGPGGNAQVRRI